MATLSITSAEFDKPQYKIGDTITLTVAYVSKSTLSGTVELKDGSGAVAGNAVVTAEVDAPHSLVVSDSQTHTWASVSDDGATAVFTTTA